MAILKDSWALATARGSMEVVFIDKHPQLHSFTDLLAANSTAKANTIVHINVGARHGFHF